MQEVVEVPCLVADPQVVLLVGDDVVEHHEVREQDLVHPPQRLEAVEVVLVRLGLACGPTRWRAARWRGGCARRVASSTSSRGAGRASRSRGRGGACAARRRSRRRDGRDRARSARKGRAPARPCATSRPAGAPAARRADEVAEQQVDLDRIARIRECDRRLRASRARPRSLPRGPRPARAAGRGPSRRGSRASGSGPAAACSANGLVAAETDPADRVGERLGRRLERPADAVLDLLASSAAR